MFFFTQINIRNSLYDKSILSKETLNTFSGRFQVRTERGRGHDEGNADGDRDGNPEGRPLLQSVRELHRHHRPEPRGRILQSRIRQQQGGNGKRQMVRGDKVGAAQGAQSTAVRGQSQAQSDFRDERRQEQGHESDFQHQSESDRTVVSISVLML